MDKDRIEEITNVCAVATGAATDDPRRIAGASLLPAILHLLAEGRQAPPEEISRSIGLPAYLAPLVASLISYVFPDAEFDADGRLLGFGLSLVPTPHEVRLAGRDVVLYAWCAPDALVLPTLIGERARITSPCAATGQAVTVVAGPDGVQEVRPESAAVTFLTETDPQNLRATGCVHQNFFASAAAAAPWLAEHPHAFTLPVADAFRLLTRRSECASVAPPQETVGIAEVLGQLVLAQLRADGHQLAEIPCRLVAKEGESFTTTSGQPAPGDVWWDPYFAGWLDSEAHRARGGGPHLIVRLPNGWDWDLDAPMSNGPGWWRTGEPPNVTAFPSVIAEDYHGFLVQGKFYSERHG